MEREFGIGGRVIVVRVRVRVRVWVAFFHKAFETDRTERFRVIGARDPPIAHVAEERLNSAAAGRHDSTSSLLSSNRNATQLLSSGFFQLFFLPQLKIIFLYITGRARCCWA